MDVTIFQQNFIYKTGGWPPLENDGTPLIYMPHAVLDAGDASANKTD